MTEGIECPEEDIVHRGFLDRLIGREASAVNAVVQMMVEEIAQLRLFLRPFRREKIGTFGIGKALLDPVQKGCGLLAEILYRLVSDYWALGLQVVFVADGPFQQHFQRIADFHGLRHRTVERIMGESEEAFSPKATTEKHIRLYENLSSRTI